MRENEILRSFLYKIRRSFLEFSAAPQPIYPTIQLRNGQLIHFYCPLRTFPLFVRVPWHDIAKERRYTYVHICILFLDRWQLAELLMYIGKRMTRVFSSRDAAPMTQHSHIILTCETMRKIQAVQSKQSACNFVFNPLCLTVFFTAIESPFNILKVTSWNS